MQEYEATITEKGQVTIPQEIRHFMSLQPRDRIRFEVEGEIVRMKRASSRLLEGYGAVPPQKWPEDFHKQREAFEEGVAREVISKV